MGITRAFSHFGATTAGVADSSLGLRETRFGLLASCKLSIGTALLKDSGRDLRCRDSLVSAGASYVRATCS